MRPRFRAACCLASVLVLALVVPASATDTTQEPFVGAEAAVGVLQVPMPTADLTATNDVHQTQAPEVVATGLDNPRGLHAVDDVVYVAESGRGGPLLRTVTSPDGFVLNACLGDSGAVTRIDQDGQTRIATGLPSASIALGTPGGPVCPASGTSATGPSDIASIGATLLVPMGNYGDGFWRDQLHPLLGQVLHVLPDNKILAKADIAAYETVNNPDGTLVDSNPYGITTRGGRSWVADAAANAVFEINGTNVSTTAVLHPFAPIPFEPPSCIPGGLPGLPPPGTLIAPESVPTQVALGHDGHLYVTTLPGFPYAAESARLYRVHPDTGEATVFADGLNHLTGLAIGPDGAVYVAEMIGAGLLEATICGNFVPGRILKFVEEGMEVIGTVTLTGGLAVASDGSVYAAAFSPFPGIGQVWKFSQD